jgi:branched-chain amino acid transport system permease protein
MRQLIEFSLIGVASGGIYALAAMGFVIIHKATNVFNFAMGEMMMIGAYLFYATDVQLGLNLAVSLSLTLAGAGLLGATIERALLRPLLGKPPIVLVMVTFGVAAILRAVATIVWSSDSLQLPELLPRAPFFLGNILVPGRLVWAFAIVMVISIGLVAYFRLSRAGIAIRATATDQVTAYCLGINVPRVFALTWVIAAIVAAISGIVAAEISGLSPQLGLVALSVLAVVVLGGLDSIEGTIAAGILMGLIEALAGAYLGASARQFLPYIAVLVILFVRPTGLFGAKVVERV